MTTNDHHRKIATTWACLQVRQSGWTLRKSDLPGFTWEATRGDTCLMITDWRDLCRFAREER